MPANHSEIEKKHWASADKLRVNSHLKSSEYFLGKFAKSEGQKGGEFFTPTSIVKPSIYYYQNLFLVSLAIKNMILKIVQK